MSRKSHTGSAVAEPTPDLEQPATDPETPESIALDKLRTEHKAGIIAAINDAVGGQLVAGRKMLTARQAAKAAGFPETFQTLKTECMEETGQASSTLDGWIKAAEVVVFMESKEIPVPRSLDSVKRLGTLTVKDGSLSEAQIRRAVEKAGGEDASWSAIKAAVPSKKAATATEEVLTQDAFDSAVRDVAARIKDRVAEVLAESHGDRLALIAAGVAIGRDEEYGKTRLSVLKAAVVQAGDEAEDDGAETREKVDPAEVLAAA
jgi:hypothetical protein